MPKKPTKTPAPRPRAKAKPATQSRGSRRAKPAQRLRLEYVTASTLTHHPENWKTHPAEQLAALAGVLSDPEVGWADAVIFNERTGRVVDGHGRLASVPPDAVVPVLVGSWSEAGERKILLTKDPIAAMAQSNADSLAALRDQVGELDAEHFAGLTGQLDELLAGLTSGSNPPSGEKTGGEGEIPPAADETASENKPTEKAAGDGETAPAADGAGHDVTRLVVIRCVDEMHQTDLLDAIDQADGPRVVGLLNADGVDVTARNG
jgi:hypothetical protein